MNRKTKITLTIIVLCGLLTLAGFTIWRQINPSSEPQPSTQWPDEVDWPTAIEILQSGQVTHVFQSHNLEVVLTVEDGSQIKTIEPAIDDIFKEVELCGDTCSEIILMTE